ncbi:hypothetical protein PCANC_17870 [Puccinia coronata f. sp. avenae]|uniref:Triosephosphate isomerase n=1 Tax=Puccinia coronata f. sp. avenae TaxID=200324 RepID=A0A2N5U6Q6_9BASI|nr:hypothetical protein PCANC_17870 [Puccinia coronata f. sp. avenae]
MVPLNLIVCATKANGIGQAGRLPWRLKEDMKFFKHLTTLAPSPLKNVVIMGRKTWQSIPHKFRPLANRINIVVSRQTDPSLLDIDPQRDSYLVNSIESACELIQQMEPLDLTRGQEGSTSTGRQVIHRVFVIGGAELYKTVLKSQENKLFRPANILMTRILSEHPSIEKSIDTFFPECRHHPTWSKSQNPQEQNAFLLLPGTQHPIINESSPDSADQKEPSHKFHFDQLIIEDSFMYKLPGPPPGTPTEDDVAGTRRTLSSHSPLSFQPTTPHNNQTQFTPSKMATRKFFVGGNFKMNGTLDSLQQLVKSFNDAELDSNTEVVVSPPALYLMAVRDTVKKNIQVGAQNGYLEKSGAFTGEISFTQLIDAKIPWVILGHSERRSLFHEDSEFVGAKTGAAVAANLSVIACIGESLAEREADKTLQVVESQLDGIKKGLAKHGQSWDRIVVAYEPVWAIGTGKVATPQQAQEVHKAIREWFKKHVDANTAESIRIIYGGSVNGKNCEELAREVDIDGFLVGGASLKPEFVQIINSGKAKL